MKMVEGGRFSRTYIFKNLKTAGNRSGKKVKGRGRGPNGVHMPGAKNQKREQWI